MLSSTPLLLSSSFLLTLFPLLSSFLPFLSTLSPSLSSHLLPPPLSIHPPSLLLPPPIISFSARVVGVERSLGPEGFTQRTSYVVNQPGLPARQLTRTIVIRPNDNRRPNDPNLPPSYNHAVTGQDKSVKVESKAVAERDLGPPPMAVQPSAPPIISLAPPADITGVPPPEYSVQAPSAPPQTNSSYYDSSGSNEETRLLLP